MQIIETKIRKGGLLPRIFTLSAILWSQRFWVCLGFFFLVFFFAFVVVVVVVVFNSNFYLEILDLQTYTWIVLFSLETFSPTHGSLLLKTHITNMPFQNPQANINMLIAAK